MNFNVSKNTSPCQVFRLRVLFDSLSIQKLLQKQLWILVSLFQSQEITISDEKRLFRLSPEQIPLYRLKNNTTLLYRCAIAPKLASIYKLSTVEIANRLFNLLPQIDSELSREISLDFTVQITLPGWIDFYLSDRALAIWLQQLPQKFLFVDSLPSAQAISSESTIPFALHYTHARCCSLLRLGHQQGLIQLRDLDFNQSIWQWLEPHPIPWLDYHSETLIFQLIQPTEKDLIAQLVVVVESLDNSYQEDWIKLASGLSYALLNFYRNCRIWGELKQKTPKLAQARLGLIALTQFLLRELIQVKLDVTALSEL